MESWASTWAHIQRTGPEALLWIGIGIGALTGTIIVDIAFKYFYRLIKKC